MKRVILGPTYADARALIEEGIGSLVYQYRAITASYTVVAKDEIIAVGTRTAVVTITLPTPTSNWDGKTYIIKDLGGAELYPIVLATTGSETVDGRTSITLGGALVTITIFTDGTNWYSI